MSLFEEMVYVARINNTMHKRRLKDYFYSTSQLMRRLDLMVAMRRLEIENKVLGDLLYPTPAISIDNNVDSI